jgi:hypothetical protein
MCNFLKEGYDSGIYRLYKRILNDSHDGVSHSTSLSFIVFGFHFTDEGIMDITFISLMLPSFYTLVFMLG